MGVLIGWNVKYTLMIELINPYKSRAVNYLSVTQKDTNMSYGAFVVVKKSEIAEFDMIYKFNDATE